jgi:hypothetical protein
MDYEVQPMEFSMLRKGGGESGYCSDALVFQNGRLWSGTGRTWQKVSFAQRTREESTAPKRGAPAWGRSR